MSGPMDSGRIVDLLLADDGGDFEGDLMVVEDFLVVLSEDLEVLADAPSADFLAELVAAVPEPTSRRRRGLRIAVTSGAIFLAATSAAAATTGSLPDSVQSAVHSVAERVGIHIPDGDNHGPPTTGGSQDGEGNGRSDEAPGRPDDPGQPADPGRSDEAPGQPEDPGSNGVGPDGDPSGQVDNEQSDPGGIDNPNAGGGNPNAGSGESQGAADPPNPNAGGGNPNAGGGNPDVGTDGQVTAATAGGNRNDNADGHGG